MINNNWFSEDNLLKRISLSKSLLERNTSSVPVIIEFKNNKYKIPNNGIIKILINNSYNISQLNCIIRKKCKIKHTEAMYLFCNNFLCPNTYTMSYLYNKYKDKDGFLYLQITFLETYG